MTSLKNWEHKFITNEKVITFFDRSCKMDELNFNSEGVMTVLAYEMA